MVTSNLTTSTQPQRQHKTIDISTHTCVFCYQSWWKGLCVQADLKLAIFEAEFWGPIVGRILNMPLLD